MYLLLLIFTVLVLIKEIRENKNLLRVVFFAAFILYYIFTPTLLECFSGKLESYQTPYLIICEKATDGDKFRTFLITLFVTALLIVLKRYKIVFGKNRKRIYYENFGVEQADYKYLDQSIYKTGIVFLIIGGMALFVLIFELGGLQQMLSLGSVIRGYISDNTEYLSSVGSICKTLSVFVTGSFFCLYASSKRHKRHKILMIISLMLSIIYLLFNAGRSSLLVFFGCIFFAFVKEHGRKVVWLVAVGFLAVVLLSSSIEVVMNNISRGLPAFASLEYNMTDNLLSTVTDLAYPYANLLALPQMIARAGYNYGIDYILWFSEVIPKRLFDFVWNIIPLNTLVTTKISQFYITSNLSMGGTPADYITYGWFQGGIIGLLINCLIYDIIIKTIDRSIGVLPKQYSIIRYRICFFMYSLVTSNDFPLMIKGNLFLLIMIIVIYRSIRKTAGVKYKT